MKKSLKLIAAACLFTVSTVCLAQASAPTSPAKKALIEKLLVLQQPMIENLAAQRVQQPMVPLMQQANAMLQQVPADKREATGKAVEADFKKFFDDNFPQVKAAAVKLAPSTIGVVLDERFTEAELRETVAWLESPTSKKMAAAQGDMMKPLLEKLMAEKGPGLEVAFKAMIGNVGKTLNAAAGQPAPGAAAPAAKPASPASKAAPIKK